MSRVPILCYHNVGPRPPGTRVGLLYVGSDQFERQLWIIRRLGLRGVAMSEGFAQLRELAAADRVVLTFDDGYLDTLTEAAPMLVKYGFRATCYIVSGCIGAHNRWDDHRTVGSKPLMTRGQIEAWLEAGMEIASHSCSHPSLDAVADEVALREMAESRVELRRLFGVAVDHFAYPFGKFTPRTIALARQAGYRSAVTTEPGIARGKDDRHRLPRLLIDGDRTLGRFLLQMATPYEDLRHGRGLSVT